MRVSDHTAEDLEDLVFLQNVSFCWDYVRIWKTVEQLQEEWRQKRERDPERESVWERVVLCVCVCVCERNKYQPKVSAIKEKDMASTLPRVGRRM